MHKELIYIFIVLNMGDPKEKNWTSIVKKFNKEGSPYFATSQLWDDGIIDPIETRDVLGNCLEYSLNSERKSGKFGIFRMWYEKI